MEVYYNYYLRKDKKIILSGYGNSNIDSITLSLIREKCAQYGISFTEFMEELINRLTMEEVEEILLAMNM